jgi:CheY-like chemotaxis protein
MDIKNDINLSKSADGIYNSAQKGSELVRQLMAFARHIPVSIKKVNLNDTAKDIIELLKRTIEKMIIIETDLAPDLWLTEIDATQFYQVILNLCVNAKESMMPLGNGKLTLATRNKEISPNDKIAYPETQPGKYVMISVSDTGIGMDTETINHIFEPFFTTKEKSKGSGLGLAIAYGIIHKHNGFIKVYSEKGKGSCFKIYLPALAATEKSESDVKEDSQILSKGEGTILMVDDELSVRDLGKSILERFGYQVIPAKGGKEALELYQQQKDKINLVILDLIMPDLGGVETLRELKKIYPDIKVLISSGYSSNGTTQEVIDIGIKGFITKPFTIKELLKEVKRIITEE